MQYLAYNTLEYKKRNEAIHCHNYFATNFYKGIREQKDMDYTISINPDGTPNSFKQQKSWDTSLIFTGSYEPINSYGYFYNHSPTPNRIHINLTAQILDIQVLQELKKEHLVFEDAIKLYEHPQLIDMNLHSMLDNYLNTKKASSLDAIGKWINRDTQQEIVMPCLYSSHIRNAGFDMTQDMRFIRFEPAMADTDIITDKDLYSIERPYDIFIVGSQIPFVYPFRHLAGKILKESKKFKILDVTKTYGTYDALRTHVLNELNKAINEKRSVGDLQSIFDFMEQKQYESYLQNMSSCKLMVSCSSIFGYPLYKYYEAMARGTVLITTDVSFANEFDFKEGVHYIKCNPNDVVDVAQELLSNDTYRLGIANNAVNLIRDRFSIKGTADKFMQGLRGV